MQFDEKYNITWNYYILIISNSFQTKTQTNFHKHASRRCGFDHFHLHTHAYGHPYENINIQYLFKRMNLFKTMNQHFVSCSIILNLLSMTSMNMFNNINK